MIKIIGIILTIAIVGLIAWITLVSKINTSSLPPIQIFVPPSKAPVVKSETGVGAEYNQSQDKINLQEQPILDKMAKIIDFKDTLPFKGTYSSLEFNIKKGKYILVIDKNNASQGKLEYENLLDKFEVDRQYMSDRLETSYK